MATQTSGKITITNASNQKLNFYWEISNQNNYTKQSKIDWTIVADDENTEPVIVRDFRMRLGSESEYLFWTFYTETEIAPGEMADEGSFTIQHPTATRNYEVEFVTRCYIKDNDEFEAYIQSENYTLPRIGTFVPLSVELEATSETDLIATCNFNNTRYEELEVMLWHENELVATEYIAGGNGDTITFDFDGLEAGELYVCTAHANKGTYQSFATSECITYSYPYCSSNVNFIIGDSINLKFHNPLQREMQIKVLGDDDSVIREYTSTASSISGWQNDAGYYASIPNKKTGILKVRVVTSVSDVTTNNGKYSVNENACMPSISSISYEDSNSTTVGITQDNSKIIRNHSIVYFTFANCLALNSATVSQIAVVINGQTKTQNCSGSSGTFNMSFGAINSSQNVTAQIKIKDSRGIEKSYTKQITMEDYQSPVINATAIRTQNFYTETTLNANVIYSSLNNRNTITLEYAYKKISDGSYSAYTAISQNTDYMVNLDNQYEWQVKFRVIDAFETATLIINVNKGIPIVFFDRRKNATGFNCFPTDEKGVYSDGLQLDDLVYIGNQCLYQGEYELHDETDVEILSGFNIELINGIFDGIEIPENYEKAFRLSAVARTPNTYCKAHLTIGGIETRQIKRWSIHALTITTPETIATRIFKASELSLSLKTLTTQVYNGTAKTSTDYELSSNNSLCLEAHQEYSSDTFYFSNIVVHGYLVKKARVLSTDLIINSDLYFKTQYALDVARMIYGNNYTYESGIMSDLIYVYVRNGSSLQHILQYYYLDNRIYVSDST